MTRVGIVIAVSEYLGMPTNLPACQTDGLAMQDLLAHTGRFDELVILKTPAETTSFHVKKVLSELADKLRGSFIEEVVFYFSGHGEFDGQEFRFILNDYDNRRKNQTSLSNSELDGIFRSVSPELYVKIVDACNAGVAYIKGEDELRDHLKGVNPVFKNLYFMFSSQADESSFANDQMSFFTRSVLDAVRQPEPRLVRYRDVMSAASDEFSNKGGQTPLFITQATNTEVFCHSSVELAAKLDRYFSGPAVPALNRKRLSLRERIVQSGDEYCNQDEADEALNRLRDLWLSFRLEDELADLYEVSVTSGDKVLNGVQGIGAWLDEAKDKTYFAKTVKRSETYKTRELKNPMMAAQLSVSQLMGKYGDDDATHEVTRTRQVTDGYELTTDQSYVNVVIGLAPKSKALTPVKCFVAPIVSRKSIMIFWRFQHYEYRDWTTTFATTVTKWVRAECRIKDVEMMHAIFADISQSFQVFVTEPLLDRWPEEAGSELDQDGGEGAGEL